MPKNRKGMHKEWHSKRLDYQLQVILNFLKFVNETYDLERLYGPDVAQAYKNEKFLDLLSEKCDYLKVDEYCGRYVVEYGYNWVSDTDTDTPTA